MNPQVNCPHCNKLVDEEFADFSEAFENGRDLIVCPFCNKTFVVRINSGGGLSITASPMN